MANTLKGWLADNTVTADPNDKILILETTGKADINKVYEEMLNEDTGLRKETIVHVTTLYERVCARLLMNGWQLNTGLFYAVPRFTGVVEGGRWNPLKNSIYVAFNQDKVIREEIVKTTVHILGEKSNVMYILEVEDRKTGIGVRFVNTKSNTVVTLDADMITANKPSELTLLVPSDLADGNYELTITTQYSNGKVLLKEPRSVSVGVHVGNGGGSDDRPEIE